MSTVSYGTRIDIGPFAAPKRRKARSITATVLSSHAASADGPRCHTWRRLVAWDADAESFCYRFTPLHKDYLAEAGDDAAALAFKRLGYCLGIGIANLINALDLPMVVIGGGVANFWDPFAESVYQTVRDYSVGYRIVAPTQRDTIEKDCTFICPATLGPSAGLLGAGLLPRLASMGETLICRVDPLGPVHPSSGAE